MQRGDVVGGRYRLTEPLASGGMGTVWRARHVELDVDVAVKVMSPALLRAPTALARFQREARAAAQLRSPHVVRVFDYGVHLDQPYLAMELLVGEDLRTHLERTGPLPLGRAAHILDALAKALRVAHAAGIVHRDLKPANVFLERSGDDEIVKVLDFGIAKDLAGGAVDGLRTSSSTVVGSPLYMSPEQVRGAVVDHRTDLWSLATLTYEMVTGRQPFEGASLGDVFARIIADAIPAPSSVLPGLPPAVDTFFGRALARSPEDRFASATDLAAAFRAGLGDQALAMTRVRAPASVVRPDAPTIGVGLDEVVPRERAVTGDDAMAPTERGPTSAERGDHPTSAGARTAPRATSDDEVALMGTVETDAGPRGERRPTRRRPWAALAAGAVAVALGAAGLLLVRPDAAPAPTAASEPASPLEVEAPATPEVAPSAAVKEAPASSASAVWSGPAVSSASAASSASTEPSVAPAGSAAPARSPASRPSSSRPSSAPSAPPPSPPVAIDPIFGVPVGGP